MMIPWRIWTMRLCLIILISVISYYTSFHYSIASIVSYPALLGNAWIIEPCTKWLSQRKHATNLYQELSALQDTHAQLEQAYAQLQAQISYLKGIKEIRAFSKRFNQTGKIAHVLARTFSQDGHFFLIDAGERDKITKDMIVLYNNALVGKVVEVYPWHSKVCLITDTQCKVGAYCAPTRACGIHEGCNTDDETQLRYVDHLSVIKEGDLVLSSGEGLIFPEGFTLGKVSCVAPDGLYKRVSVTPECDLKQIEYCMVMAKGDLIN